MSLYNHTAYIEECYSSVDVNSHLKLMNFLGSKLVSVSLLILCDLRTDSSTRTESLMVGCTNPGRQNAWANKLCNLTNIICGSSVWNFLHGSFLDPKILGMVSRFFENVCICLSRYIFSIIYTSHSRGKYIYHVFWY